MRNKLSYLFFFAVTIVFCSCRSTQQISVKYYEKNEKVLDSIEASYKVLNAAKPFALQFTNKKFNEVSIDIITDSLRYVYAFSVGEPRFNDTLRKYGLNAPGITSLVQQMQSIKCTWINNLSYNTDRGMRSLTFMSIRQVSTNWPFVPPKYYILAWFNRPQAFDKDGRLLTGRRLRKVSKINGEEFMRINDKVCYTISSSFR